LCDDSPAQHSDKNRRRYSTKNQSRNHLTDVSSNASAPTSLAQAICSSAFLLRWLIAASLIQCMRLIILSISRLVTCTLLLAAISAPGHLLAQSATTTTAASSSTTTTKKWPDPARYEKTIREFENTTETIPANAVLAYGSSSIRGWHKTIREDLAPLPVIPRGFGGSNMNDALHFAERVVVPHKPRAVLLYEGDNDVAGSYPRAEIVDKYEQFIALVKKALPDTHIYIISVKPSALRWKFWPAMKELNSDLQKLADADPNVTFIDVATPMLNADGNPKPEIFLADNLHMNAKGYEIWTKTVRPILMERDKKLP
jgi:lysophospholipase L1-like esterase